ncbi:MAG: Maf family nucleotide pyrophosphatase [Cyclobacteriaceae bacterium]
MMKLNRNLILASQSPRRQELTKALGLAFKIASIDVEENYPENLPLKEVAIFLAEKKALAYQPLLQNEDLLITADTVVICENQILNKPKNKQEAVEMLLLLSGKTHEVRTGVCLMDTTQTFKFDDVTQVQFAVLDRAEIDHYIEKHPPFDKAGAYGIQEWIGMIGIQNINGCYYNVMGLPVHKIYRLIKTHYIISL